MDYNAIATEYEKAEQDATTLWGLGYPEVIRFLSPVFKKEILDYGCGTGIFCRQLFLLDGNVTGVDISERMIDVARQNSPPGIDYFDIVSGDLSRFSDQSFDHVVSNFVLCAVPSKQIIRRILCEIFRVLRKNGTFIMMNSNWERSNGKEFVSYRLDRCENLVSECRIRAVTKSDPPIVFEDFFRSASEYEEMIRGAGLTLEAIREPLAPDDEPFWLDEKKYPPFYIISARKLKDR
jgi:ubiquinone/menaquinone biosynthesis C-methylase UbiE